MGIAKPIRNDDGAFLSDTIDCRIQARWINNPYNKRLVFWPRRYYTSLQFTTSGQPSIPGDSTDLIYSFISIEIHCMYLRIPLSNSLTCFNNVNMLLLSYVVAYNCVYHKQI